jgi:aspartyl-tRNA(Asn)/glutamyl-tRNA(Gln) amidotransferase subunit A
MLPPGDLCALSATEAARLIRARNLSPVELVDSVFARIHALGPVLHAFCTVAEEQARAAAQAAEHAIMRGAAVGKLLGVPLSVKDLICTKDIVTASGSAAYRAFLPEEDDVCVERLLAAGAIVLGKTNVPEFGYAGVGRNAVFPETANPWDPAMTPGGSSAGSAAAVASGMGAVALGSDGGGSIRGPASFCGIFGMKPSFGRVPLYPGCRDPRFPGMSSWETIEHIGPMTRTVEDAALLLDVIAGPDDRDRHSLPSAGCDWLEVMRQPLGRLRIAFTEDFGFSKVDTEVREITAAAARVFADDLGCEVVEDTPALSDMFDLFLTLIMRDSDLRGMRAMAARGDIAMPGLLGLLARDWSAEDFTDAAMRRQEVCNTMWRFMRRYDLLLTPTVSTPAFSLGCWQPETIEGVPADQANASPFTYPFNWTGQPAASVPVGWTSTGLPVGLQIVGRRLDDALVLRAAAAYEAVRPWRDRWPGVVSSASDP